MANQESEIQLNRHTFGYILSASNVACELETDKLTLNKEEATSSELNPIILQREYSLAQQEFNYRKTQNEQLHIELNELKARLKQAEEKIFQQEEQIKQLNQAKEVAMNQQDDDKSQMFIAAQHNCQKQNQSNKNRFMSNYQDLNKYASQKPELNQEYLKKCQEFQQTGDQNAISCFNQPHFQTQLATEYQNQNYINDIKNVSFQQRETSDIIPTQRQILKGKPQQAYEESKMGEQKVNTQSCFKKLKEPSFGKDQLKFDITSQIVALGYEQLKEGALFKPKPQKAILRDNKQRQIQNKSSFDAVFIKKNQEIIEYKNNLEQKFIHQIQQRNSVQPRLNKPSNLLYNFNNLIQNPFENQLKDIRSNKSNQVISQKDNLNSTGNQNSQQDKSLPQNKIEDIQISKLNDNQSNLYSYQINSKEKINIQIFKLPNDNQGQTLTQQEARFNQLPSNQQEKSNIFTNSLSNLPENSDYYQNQKDFFDQSQSQVHQIFSNQPSQNTIQSFKNLNASSVNNKKSEYNNQNNTNSNYSNKKSNIAKNCQEITNKSCQQNQNASAQSLSSLGNNTNKNSIRVSENTSEDISSYQNNNNYNINLLNNIALNQTAEQIPSSSEDLDNFEVSLGDSNMVTMIDQDPEQMQYEEQRRLYQSVFNNLNEFGNLGDLLFEEFMIIGPDVEQLKDLVLENPNPFRECCQDYIKGTIQQNIIFSQPCYTSPFQDDWRQQMAKFAFPNGIQYYRFKSQSDLSNVPDRFKDILLMDLCKQKQCKIDKNIFLLTLYGKQDTRGINISLEQTNSNTLMYGICYQQEDLLVVQDELSNEKTIFLFPTVYCVMTYYPFIDYFLKIILEIVNRIKTIRLIIGSFSCQIDNNLQNIDLEKVIEYLQRDRELSLSLSILQIEQVRPDRVLTYFLKNSLSCLQQWDNSIQSYQINRITNNNYAQFDTISFRVPQLEDMCYLEGLETAYLTFSNLSYSDFQFIFTLIMLEKKIVFLSKNITLLTFTIITFQNIIKPFKYPYTIISSISIDKLDFLDSIFPIIFGVNLSSELFQHQCGYNDEFYYIDLDKNIITSFNPIDIDTIYDQRFKFTTQKEQIKQLFKQINNNIASRQLGNKFKKIFQASQNNKELVYNPDERQMQNLKNLLFLIRSSIYECIVNKSIDANIIQENDTYEQLKIKVQNKLLRNNFQDKAFLEGFVQTQTFSYFIQQIYE
ncbi:hypothetical protein ABPG74_006791 [Tetrahymena malaccensis]